MAKISSLLRRNRPTRTRPYNPEVLFRDNWRDYDFEKQELFDQVYGRIEEYSPFSDELFKKYYDENRVVGGELTTKEFAICKIFLHIDWDELFMIWKNPPLSFLRKFKKYIDWRYYFKYCKITEKTIREFRGWKYKDYLVDNKYFTGDLVNKFKHYYINRKHGVSLQFIQDKATKKIVMNNLYKIIPLHLTEVIKKFNFTEKEFDKILKYCKNIDSNYIERVLIYQPLLCNDYKNKIKMLWELNK